MPDQKAFLEFLTDGVISLAEDPIHGMETVYSGGASNPDGAVTVLDTEQRKRSIFFENKTWRRTLDTQQLKNHLALHCTKPESFLLVITPRPSDRVVAQSVSKKVFFKTWDQIASKLAAINRKLNEPAFIITQFLDYGNQSAEFINMEIEKSELNAYVTSVAANVNGKINGLFDTAVSEFPFDQLGIKGVTHGINDHWGRHGAEIYFKHKKKYEQWMFFGIYYDSADHGIAFKKAKTPELAFFLDIDPGYREKLTMAIGIKDDIAKLRKEGFDDNLFGRVTSNQWRILSKRTSLTELNGLTLIAVTKFMTETLRTLTKSPVLYRELF
jgi:hypothetical protein